MAEGSPPVPQQPVERWTIAFPAIEGPPKLVEVVPALVAERLAEALAGCLNTDDQYVYRRARAALSAYESGGATKPGRGVPDG